MIFKGLSLGAFLGAVYDPTTLRKKTKCQWDPYAIHSYTYLFICIANTPTIESIHSVKKDFSEK